MRVAICIGAFAVFGVLLESVTGYVAFQARGHQAWSSTDIALLYLAFWPQLAVARFGWEPHTVLASFSVNAVGWVLLGFIFGMLWTKRLMKPTSII